MEINKIITDLQNVRKQIYTQDNVNFDFDSLFEIMEVERKNFEFDILFLVRLEKHLVENITNSDLSFQEKISKLSNLFK